MISEVASVDVEVLCSRISDVTHLCDVRGQNVSELHSLFAQKNCCFPLFAKDGSDPVD